MLALTKRGGGNRVRAGEWEWEGRWGSEGDTHYFKKKYIKKCENELRQLERTS